MNKDEMIEEMAKITNFTAFDYRQGTIQSKTIYTAMAEALYNAGYRKVGEDEIVVKKSEYYAMKYFGNVEERLVQAKQETAIEIISIIIDDDGADLNKIAKKYGIELE